MGRHEKILKRGEDIAVSPDSHQPHEGHWTSVFPMNLRTGSPQNFSSPLEMKIHQ
jgi:hypothetical protein